MKLLTVLLVGLLSLPVLAENAKIGEEAPEFTLKTTTGEEHSLADFKGKLVVLEWTNYDCPFVVKHYGSGNMQMLHEKYGEKDVAWLSICSSAPGKQGNFTPEVWAERIAASKVKVPVLLDADGKVGKAYGAKTTPHMYIVDKQGKLVYQGAIDDNRSWDPKTIEGARNYVAEALDALLEGKPVPTAESTPYGCSVKY